MNRSSPAYSIRISVGDSTSKRACPLTTARGAASSAADVPAPEIAAVAARTNPAHTRLMPAWDPIPAPSRRSDWRERY